MKQVQIYTDGACSGNPGPGGWGAILIYGTHQLELSGYQPQTTNNQMELYAAIAALDKLKEPCCVTLYSDSAYLINGFNQRWVDNWSKNSWKTASKKPVENQQLWRQLLELREKHQITWIKVKGHADNPWNNRCDALATGEIKKQRG